MIKTTFSMTAYAAAVPIKVEHSAIRHLCVDVEIDINWISVLAAAAVAIV